MGSRYNQSITGWGAFVRWYVAILYYLIRGIGRLPLPVLHRIGTALGWVLLHTPNAVRRKAEANLSIVITQFPGESRQQLLKSAMFEAGKSLFEVCKIWSGSVESAQVLVREVHGLELLDQAIAARRGMIFAAPHLGCWELLTFWVCKRTPLAIAYRPPRQPALEPLLLRARHGARAVEQVRADGPVGVRKLYKRLVGGGVVGILPDQQPKQGDGEFAPFFGTPALTMVLLSRLAQRTGATVLFAFAERLPRGAGYRLHILPAPPGIADPDLPTAVAALNRGVETCVRLAPAQYQWHYKRYSIRPPGESQPLR
jgi:Kdo2-lipid IVA lauroyltransferase/acyltransferase